MDRQTHDFYSARAEEWAAALPHEVSPQLARFLALLPAGAHVLDLGCGDGRDAAAMEAAGFRVDATDGVPAMVDLASRRLSRPARLLLFDDLDALEAYDAVWAHASLLHVYEEDLPAILARVWQALRPGGWHFACYKGGDGGHRDPFGRFYSYISRESLLAAYAEAGEWAQLDYRSEMGGSYGAGPTQWHYLTMQRPANG